MPQRETRVPPLYQRRRPGAGSRTTQLAGVQAALKAGDDATADGATWLVDDQTIGNMVPQPGDRMRDVKGQWWEITAVEKVGEDGKYPCRCVRVSDDPAPPAPTPTPTPNP